MRSHFHIPLRFRTVDDLKPISAEINARPQQGQQTWGLLGEGRLLVLRGGIPREREECLS